MADESKPEQTEEAPPKKSKKMLFILLAAVVLSVGGTAAFFVLGGDKAEAAEDGSAVAETTTQDDVAGIVSLNTFLVNLNDQNGDRYMKLTMQLTVAPESAADKISSDELLMARVRDRILTVLMSKSFQELTNPLGKDGLRQEIKIQVDSLLDKGAVRDVLFAEFVVQ